MPLPGNVTTRTVTGRFTRNDGAPAVGWVRFRPAVDYLLDATADTVIVTVPAVQVTLDATGAFTTNLIVTDDADLNPVDWTYRVHAWFEAGPPSITFSMALPAGDGTAVDLADVAFVATSTGEPIIVGPAGPQGPPGPSGGGSASFVLIDGGYTVQEA